MELEIIEEEEDDGPLPEDDIVDDSGVYHGSSGGRATSYPATGTRSREDENTESDLIVRPLLDRYLLLGLHIYF